MKLERPHMARKSIFDRVRENPQVNALVRALGGWGQVEVVVVVDLRVSQNPDSSTEQFTFVETQP